MRFEKGHKEQTRQRIIDTAARKFRQEGVAATGIAGLMAEAGLTHGGFYAHFGSKEELVREAMDAAMAQTLARRQRVLETAPPGPESLEALIRWYLRPAHRDTPGQGCAAAALASEIARHEPETRAAFTTRLRALAAQLGQFLPVPDEAARAARAMALFGTLMGCLQMARAVNDPDLSAQILEGGVAAALALAQAPAG